MNILICSDIVERKILLSTIYSTCFVCEPNLGYNAKPTPSFACLVLCHCSIQGITRFARDSGGGIQYNTKPSPSFACCVVPQVVLEGLPLVIPKKLS